jgi:hypothetical protein
LIKEGKAYIEILKAMDEGKFDLWLWVHLEDTAPWIELRLQA